MRLFLIVRSCAAATPQLSAIAAARIVLLNMVETVLIIPYGTKIGIIFLKAKNPTPRIEGFA
jgi:hypothetical protein